MQLDDLDLRDLAARLSTQEGEFRGYLRGKSALRDAVEALVECSELEAEELVDTLESRGYLRYTADPAAPSEASAPWQIDPGAEL